MKLGKQPTAKTRGWRPGLLRACGALTCLVVGTTMPSWFEVVSQQQFQGICTRAKIQIAQELTIERVGFLATLEVTNNDPDDPITDFSAELTFENPALSTPDAKNDSSSLFFVRAPQLENVSSVNGDGVIGPTKKAVVNWFIIPKISAGGSSPEGVRYRVGCKLAGKMNGVPLPPDVLFAVPDEISVKPEPQLDIVYFQPRHVQGDDPFTTDVVESPVPFTLGVIVKNIGYGVARAVKMVSDQPRIVENKSGLLLVAQLIGARVMDSVRQPTLTLEFGDMMPAQARKGAWDMVTSLSGEFIEFKARYRHVSELGGEETSVIKSMQAHFIEREVLNDQYGRDKVLDFLADTDRDPEMLPDALYESEGAVFPVNHLAEAAVEGDGRPGGTVTVRLFADKAGWGYVRVPDPGQGRLRLASVIRSDGKVMNTNNVWLSTRYTRIGNLRQDWLNIFDWVELRGYEYAVTYAVGLEDRDPPVTTMYFAGAVTEAGGKFYITPSTQIYFIAEDINPVSMYYYVDAGPFVPALPFRIESLGEHRVVFHSVDVAGNRELNRTNTVVVSGAAALEFSYFEVPPSPITVAGDALSIRSSKALVKFVAGAAPVPVNARVDVFQGVIGWVTVGGVPSSPTRSDSASLTVGGQNVDYYKYRVDGGPWSSDRPVKEPVGLSGLSQGEHVVDVLGRSRYGGYMPDSYAVRVSWKVDSNAPPTEVIGAPATPSRLQNVILTVGGEGVTHYRWNINQTFYRPEVDVKTPLVVTNILAGDQTVFILGKALGVYQPTNNPTTVKWTYDPLYGIDLSALRMVQSLTFTNIGTAVHTYTWDGRSSNGVVLPAGAYTVRVILSDALGRTNFATGLLHIDNLLGASQIVAEVARGPKRPHARRNLMVWQDQSDGNWEVYARDLRTANSSVIKLTDGALNQENPRTDGQFVVWQGRQPNGNWDVLVKDIQSNDPPVNLTNTSDQDEINPAIDWPWVVYQVRSMGSLSSPWLVCAQNVVTGNSALVWPSNQDQLDPDVEAGQVVWQDMRDPGPGEIYYANLETGRRLRVTTNEFGQYHPTVCGAWIAWQDNRHGQVEIYGYDLLRRSEVRITHTDGNETRPFLDGSWLVCVEDSLGPLTGNLMLIHLPSLNSVPITRTHTLKDRPSLAGDYVIWEESVDYLSDVRMAELPSLQAVFNNQNTVAITPALAAAYPKVFPLLERWYREANVREITRYVSLVPSVVTETARWDGLGATGINFPLQAGWFLWIRFGGDRVIDLGNNPRTAIDLEAGVNVFSYAHFPSQFSSYQLIHQLGMSRVRWVRMLDSETGRWLVSGVDEKGLYGEDFVIPKVAILMIEMTTPVNGFRPQ